MVTTITTEKGTYNFNRHPEPYVGWEIVIGNVKVASVYTTLGFTLYEVFLTKGGSKRVNNEIEAIEFIEETVI